jgi:hypothetical protein
MGLSQASDSLAQGKGEYSGRLMLAFMQNKTQLCTRDGE